MIYAFADNARIYIVVDHYMLLLCSVLVFMNVTQPADV